MAFKLTKAELKRKDELVADLTKARAELEDELNVFNEAVAAAGEALNHVVNRYNVTLNEARDWCEDIANERQEQYDNSSERWQESDKGSNASEWVNAYTNHGLDEIEEYEIPNYDAPSQDDANTVDDLPLDAEY